MTDSLRISVEGRNHYIEGIGNGEVLKSIRSGCKTRSAVEQFQIHSYAYSFASDILHIPKPVSIVDRKSYTMEEFETGVFVHPDTYFHSSTLFDEVIRFYKYMMDAGYWPYGYTIYKYNTTQYVLCDFSGFGTIQGQCVKFPKDPRVYALKDMERRRSPRFYYYSLYQADAKGPGV